MNAEVIKAMNKKEKKHTLRKWWRKNGVKVLQIALFPITAMLWAMLKISDAYEKWRNSRNAWSEERANEILSYYIPRKARWNNEAKEFWFFDNGLGWDIHFAKKYLKRKDRRFWDIHRGFYGSKIRNYLIEKFELEGFTKIVANCYEFQTEIIFVLKEKEA